MVLELTAVMVKGVRRLDRIILKVTVMFWVICVYVI